MVALKPKVVVPVKLVALLGLALLNLDLLELVPA